MPTFPEIPHMTFHARCLAPSITLLHAAASTGSIRGAVRALFRTGGANGSAISAGDGSAAAPSEPPAVELAGSRNNFSDVSLSDSPR